MPRRKPKLDEARPRRNKETVVRKKDCPICSDQATIDFKQPDLLRKFMTERGKILSRRYTGACAQHQRQLTTAIKRARVVLLVR